MIGVTHESLHLDFKRDRLHGINQRPRGQERNNARAQHARETARDIVQFANTEGGTLLYGVEEADDATAWKVATAVRGVPEPDAFMEFLGQSVRPLVQPTGYSFTWRPLTWIDGTAVVAVDAPPLATGIGCRSLLGT